VLLSVSLYFLHYSIFRDAHHIFIYFIGDVAFVPVEVLLVTLIIHQLLTIRERKTRFEKLNMVIGAFFSEAGTKLLTFFSDHDPRLDDIRQKLIIKTGWKDREFSAISKRLKKYSYSIRRESIDLPVLAMFLASKRDFLLRLLENPNLLEHEKFTDLLWAVFHLTEELSLRKDLKNISGSDLEHLTGDIDREYSLLVQEWLRYMNHTKNNYPYLFSLALRTNPFDEKASPEIT
jgi:hypothetical protein